MKEFFTVFNEATDISNDMRSFSTDEVDFVLLDNQTFRVGFRKAFSLIYFEISSPNQNQSVLSMQYNDGNGLKDLKIIDETRGFSKSGFILFERPEDIVDTEFENISKKFLEIKTDTSFSAETKLKGVGIVFCNEQDVIDIRSNVIKLNNGNSLINKIALARDHIINEYNQQGNFKISKDRSNSLQNGLVLSEINEFDFLKIDSLRLACAYLAIALLFIEEKSDKEDDKWIVQGRRFRKTAGQRMTSHFLNLDLDDDGIADIEETNAISVINLTLD